MRTVRSLREPRCAEVDPELWFPEEGQSPKPAKSICAGCPVLTACLEYALYLDDAFGEQYGVWGGMTRVERRELRLRPGRAVEEVAA